MAAIESTITNDTLYWGSYRPNLYFGMRNRSPSSFMSGIMWHGVREHRDGREFEQMRHSCEQGDKMRRYGWQRHDGVSFGEQEIEDPHNDLFLSTTFVKFNADENSKGNWTARISGRSLSGNNDVAIALYYYFSFERTLQDLSAEYFALPSTPSKGLGEVSLDGFNQELGKFHIEIKENTVEHPAYSKKDKLFKALGELSKTHVYGSSHYPNSDLWKTKEITQGLLKKEYFRLLPEIMSAQQSADQGKSNNNKRRDDLPTPTWFLPTLPNTVEANSNLVIFQTLLKVPFEIDIVFVDLSEESGNKKPKKKTTGLSSELEEAIEAASGSALTSEIEARQKSFDAKFERIFPLVQFRDADFARFAKSTFSNLIGGIGYFHGSGLMKYADKESHVTGPKSGLYTAVPSRPFFPRGFLWDEGFHQLLIHKWNPVITSEVLSHWFHLMDRNGWIPREQILGEEARSKVPAEYQVQHWNYANPPTFFLVFEKFVNLLLHEKATIHEAPSSNENFASTLSNNNLPNHHNITFYQHVVEELFPKLQKWNKWFRTTQLGEATGESIHYPFMWQGRTQNHTLTSGLDDYPRAENVSRRELHVDLLCWMIKSTQILKNSAQVLNHNSVKYAEMESNMLAQLEAIHWNEAGRTYDDVIIREDGSKQFIHHVGYVSLFPLALGLIPKDSEKLLHTLQLIKDPNQLWSDFGILSLSKQDAYYTQGENYWTGPIWINMNYLVLSSLYNNYIRDGPYAQQATEVYTALRNNLIRNMFEEFKNTGYVWENYDPNNGRGQRSHPFTGWSALIVAIITEQY